MYDKEVLEVKKKVDKLLAHKIPQYKQGYNKAIEDFIYKIQSNNSIADFMKDYLQEIAEELKS